VDFLYAEAFVNWSEAELGENIVYATKKSFYVILKAVVRACKSSSSEGFSFVGTADFYGEE
jgi:hypothetical protein